MYLNARFTVRPGRSPSCQFTRRPRPSAPYLSEREAQGELPAPIRAWPARASPPSASPLRALNQRSFVKFSTSSFTLHGSRSQNAPAFSTVAAGNFTAHNRPEQVLEK